MFEANVGAKYLDPELELVWSMGRDINIPAILEQSYEMANEVVKHHEELYEEERDWIRSSKDLPKVQFTNGLWIGILDALENGD